MACGTVAACVAESWAARAEVLSAFTAFSSAKRSECCMSRFKPTCNASAASSYSSSTCSAFPLYRYAVALRDEQSVGQPKIGNCETARGGGPCYQMLSRSKIFFTSRSAIIASVSASGPATTSSSNCDEDRPRVWWANRTMASARLHRICESRLGFSFVAAAAPLEKSGHGWSLPPQTIRSASEHGCRT